jgi:hypothetical protein
MRVIVVWYLSLRASTSASTERTKRTAVEWPQIVSACSGVHPCTSCQREALSFSFGTPHGGTLAAIEGGRDDTHSGVDIGASIDERTHHADDLALLPLHLSVLLALVLEVAPLHAHG